MSGSASRFEIESDLKPSFQSNTGLGSVKVVMCPSSNQTFSCITARNSRLDESLSIRQSVPMLAVTSSGLLEVVKKKKEKKNANISQRG